MKKVLALFLLASAAILTPEISMASATNSGEIAAPRVEYSSTTTMVVPQRDRGRGRVRTRYVTRIVRQGRHVYRVTYRVTTFRDGRTVRTLISRVRIR